MDTLKKYWYIPVTVLTVVVLLCALYFIPLWQAQSYRSRIEKRIEKLKDKARVDAEIQLEKEFDAIENTSRTTLAQIIGGIVVLVGLYVTFQNLKVARKNAEIALRNTEIAEEGKLTDRFSKAVEMLGSEKLEVRLGGIYALERISRDSQKDHWAVMQVLTAYVRRNALEEIDENEDTVYQIPKEDIQAVMTVIGRRKWRETETGRLNLNKVYLRDYDFTDLDLSEIEFRDANFNNAKLHRTNFNGSIMQFAKFENSKAAQAKFAGAFLESADFRKAVLTGADFTNAMLTKANLTNTVLENAELSTSTGVRLSQISSAIEPQLAKLPPKLKSELNELNTNQNSETVVDKKK